jgi:hypothetical protein
MRPRPVAQKRVERFESQEKLFTQVIEAAKPRLLKLWKEGDLFFPKSGVNCPDEIQHSSSIGRSYYQCNPHFWQCYWQKGVKENPVIEVDLFGQKYHIEAIPSFNGRFYDLYKSNGTGPLKYGYMVEISVNEFPGQTQTMILADSCRDTYLPQRIYGYGKVNNPREDGFIWDNFDRQIFIDKFYVTNRQTNEWYKLTGHEEKIIKDPKLFPLPALLSLDEQRSYCAFYGKRLMEAKLFDAASMTPSDLKNPLPEKVSRPATPWQRDLSKTFLGMARINPDYELTPLDCQLAQVKGCEEKYFTTDSVTWMGMNYPLGFNSESVENRIDPKKNLKKSSRAFKPASQFHELGVYDSWDEKQPETSPVAFRCYEEVSK